MGALEVLWGERQGGVGWERTQEEAKKWASSLLTSVLLSVVCTGVTNHLVGT